MKIRNIPTRHILFALALLGVGAATLFATHALRPASAATENAPKPALTITVTHPQTSSIASSFAANGNIVAWQDAVIGAIADLAEKHASLPMLARTHGTRGLGRRRGRRSPPRG